MKQYQIHYLLILLFFVACKNKKIEEKDSSTGIEVDIPKLMSAEYQIKLKPDRILTLKEDSTCFISSFNKIIFADDEIIIKDQTARKVYHFDIDGTLKSVLTKSGEGPDEYLNGTDIFYDPEVKSLAIWNAGNNTLKYFDTSGHSTRMLKLGNQAGHQVLYTNGMLLFDKINFGAKNGQYSLFKYNAQNANYEFVKEFGGKEIPRGLHFICDHNSDWDNKSFYIIPFLENSIYKIQEDGNVSKIYTINIKDKSYKFIDNTENLKKFADARSLINYADNNRFIYAFHDLYYFENLGIVFSFFAAGKEYYYYNFKDSKVRRISSTFTDKSGNTFRISNLISKYRNNTLVAGVSDIQNQKESNTLAFININDL